jgi:multidrug efflux system outer membrane protein
LRIATANLREARALRREAQFDLGPVVTGVGSYTHSLASKDAEPFAPRSERNLSLYDVGFDATWELDVFGRVRRSVQAATADVQTVEAERRDVLVSLISEVARNYFELRGAQGELAVAQRNADNQRETVKITEARLEGGRGTELDVAQARAQLNSTLASIPPQEQAIAHAIHRLSVLIGEQPTALTAELSEAKPLVALPTLVAIGKPEELLRRRPDIRAAERTLAAATARIGVATADLFPRVTFNGSIGLEAASIAGLGKSGADNWSFGPSITWAALDYGHVRARMKASDARAEAALATYERTVLTSLEETENALVDFGRERVRHDFLNESVLASETAAKLARQRFENGATDFLTVLDAERVLYQGQDQLAQSQTRTATALVAVYKSLGGGWEVELEKKGDSKTARR